MKRRLQQFGVTALFVAAFEGVAWALGVPLWTACVAAVLIGIAVSELWPDAPRALRTLPTHLLGKNVRVTIHRHEKQGGPAVVQEGKLLGFGDDGEFVIERDDGFVYYCWPMLDIEAVTTKEEHQ